MAHGGTAYDHANGDTYILDFNHCLDMTKQNTPSLLNPNQLRLFSIIVDDTPKHLSVDYFSTHSIQIPEHDLTLNLELDAI